MAISVKPVLISEKQMEAIKKIQEEQEALFILDDYETFIGGE